MIISHKHKFIFVKTHKTSTQTFMKFIKPHLGDEDVMVGDPSSDHNENTKLNVDKVFETGKSAQQYQDTYGNHLPWFMIKDIVGDDIWNNYTKFTIEREPHDRLLSLFYFLNPQVTGDRMIFPAPEFKKSHAEAGTIPKMVEWLQSETLLTLYPEQVREYFEEWTLTQLNAGILNIKKPLVYGSDSHKKENRKYIRSAKRQKFKRLVNLPKTKIAHTDPNNNLQYIYFPYIEQTDVLTWRRPYERGQHMNGQCRFLNYGYYYDGKDVQVDHVINFKDVANSIGRLFKESGIDIECNKNLYDNATQNAHYRNNARAKKIEQSWWYSGNRKQELEKSINKLFYNNKFNLNNILS